jgi:hypothetical protein
LDKCDPVRSSSVSSEVPVFNYRSWSPNFGKLVPEVGVIMKPHTLLHPLTLCSGAKALRCAKLTSSSVVFDLPLRKMAAIDPFNQWRVLDEP